MSKMDNPKVYIALLLISGAILFLLSKALTPVKNQATKGIVLSETLTQSLDGHRLFLNIRLDNSETILIQSRPALGCSQGDIVRLTQETTKFSNQTHYTVTKCFKAEDSLEVN